MEGVYQYCCVDQMNNKSGNLFIRSCYLKKKKEPTDLVTETHEPLSCRQAELRLGLDLLPIKTQASFCCILASKGRVKTMKINTDIVFLELKKDSRKNE